MDKNQRIKLRKHFRVQLLEFFSSQDKVQMVIGEINSWLYENSYEEFAVAQPSTYGFHILISDSEFLKGITI